MPRAQIKDEEQYQALRREDASKERAARTADASANTSRSSTDRKGGTSQSDEDWTRKDPMKRAAEIGIDGRSSMSKDELVDAPRNH